MSRSGPHGYQPSTKFSKTGEFWLDVARGIYAPNWQNVLKFGVNKSVANGTWELISQTSAAYPLISTATTVRVKAGGDAADTLLGAGANTVRVVGLNSDATAQITEDIDLAGASASASTTQTFFRVYHAEVVGCGTYATAYNTGPIVIENTAGTLDLITIEAAHSMSQHLAFSAPAGLSVVILGEETHVLTEAELAAHAHGGDFPVYNGNFGTTGAADSKAVEKVEKLAESGVDVYWIDHHPWPSDDLDEG